MVQSSEAIRFLAAVLVLGGVGGKLTSSHTRSGPLETGRSETGQEIDRSDRTI